MYYPRLTALSPFDFPIKLVFAILNTVPAPSGALLYLLFLELARILFPNFHALAQSSAPNMSLSSIAPNPTTTPPPPPYLLDKRKGPKTVTETITIHNSIFYVSFATEQQFLTLTDTVYVNRTVFLTNTITQTATRPAITQQTPTTVLLTTTFAPTSMNACHSAIAAGTPLQPVSATQDEKLDGAAIAGIVIGSLVGLGLVMGLVWFGVRKWRAWKAKGNRRMNGVELQRRWEREQEMRATGGDV
ncbi:MAG: hypothetical protein L6R40_005573 [Gallowayella cf. fulva]|nr:MAG: hypothetical protein L6R40_005573 [Xanthomendoza cf. fulva]